MNDDTDYKTLALVAGAGMCIFLLVSGTFLIKIQEQDEYIVALRTDLDAIFYSSEYIAGKVAGNSWETMTNMDFNGDEIYLQCYAFEKTDKAMACVFLDKGYELNESLVIIVEQKGLE